MFRAFGWGLAVLLLFSVRAQTAESPRQAAIAAMYPVMIKALETGNFAQARNICDQWIVWEPQNPNHHYNLACIEARSGEVRLPFAIPALQRAAELGFHEIGTLKEDPDLAPVRSDARFAEIVRLVSRNAGNAERNAAAAALTPTAPADAATPGARAPGDRGATLDEGDKPAPAKFDQGLPVGLYFMTRFWSFTGTLEKVVWYFAPDGTVYQSLEDGFSAVDLANHQGPRGKAALNGQKLEVTWRDKKVSSSELERSDTGFMWDAAIFTPARPFTPDMPLAGKYEGGESISYSGNRAAVSRMIQLRPDGTYTWSGVSFLSSASNSSQVTAGSNGADSSGRWHLGTYSLVLVDHRGTVYRRIAFPYDDEKTAIKPDRFFFGGTMFKKQE